jgi:hypothetical protein
MSWTLHFCDAGMTARLVLDSDNARRLVSAVTGLPPGAPICGHH